MGIVHRLLKGEVVSVVPLRIVRGPSGHRRRRRRPGSEAIYRRFDPRPAEGGIGMLADFDPVMRVRLRASRLEVFPRHDGEDDDDRQERRCVIQC